jgi:hypothetical protein
VLTEVYPNKTGLPLRHSTKRYTGVTCLLAALLPIVVRLLLLPLMPPPVPSHQDEFSYLLGADTFASGRVTNPSHPMWVHFETFHVNQQPTYGSKYPPAQALFLAFGQKLFGNPWFGVLLSVGLMCAAFCWMLQGWVEPLYAALTTLLVIATWGITGDWMNSYWGGAVAAIGGALVIGAIPRLVRQVSFAAVLFASIGIVVLANSRPYEGLLTIVSSAAVLLWRMRHERRRWAALLKPRALAAFVLVIVPAAAAMGYYNYRHTGSALLFPYTVNERTYAASPRFYLSPPIPSPVYRHESIRRLWEWDRNLYLAARANPLAPVAFAAPFVGPFYFWNVLGLAALVGLLFGKRSTVIPALGILALPIVGVLLEKSFLPHYLAPLCGAWLVLGAAGLEAARRWRIGIHNAGPLVALILGVLAFGSCISDVGEAARAARQRPRGILMRPLLVEQLQHQGGRHLILVRYSPTHYIHSEWVYNAADIDGAAVVWARDMGVEKNRELLDYYRDRKAWLLEPDVDPVKLVPIVSGL